MMSLWFDLFCSRKVAVAGCRKMTWPKSIVVWSAWIFCALTGRIDVQARRRRINCFIERFLEVLELQEAQTILLFVLQFYDFMRWIKGLASRT